MRIVFVLTQSLDSPSGLGRYGPLAREMAKMGHEIEVIALHHAWRQLSARRYIDAGVRVSYVGQMHVTKDGSHKRYFNPSQLLLVSMASTMRLARALWSSSANIIHLGKPQPFNVLAARFARRGRPVFCDCDDYEAATNRFTGRWQRGIVRYFEDDIVNRVKGLTVNTRFTKARYVKLGFPEDRIVYVPNGVERSRFAGESKEEILRRQLRIPPGEPVVAYIGTLGLHSHPVNLLLEAFKLVLSRLRQSRLILVGGGEDYDELQRQASALGIANRTIFCGRVPQQDVPSYFKLATVTVDPVYDDPIAKARSPLKILESLTVGIPVVTCDVGDRRALLADGELGELVGPGNAKDLADGILTLLCDAKRRAEIRDAARRHRERWYWDQLVKQFIQVYAIA